MAQVEVTHQRLSLWESWHAIGVTERGSALLKTLSVLAFRRDTSPKGRGMGASRQ